MSDRTRRMASQRSERNRYSKTHHGVLGDPSRIDRDGILGERAFARYMGMPEDSIEVDRPVGCNFILENGTRVDVRASRADFARLLVEPRTIARRTIDVFVLAQIIVPKQGEPDVDDVILRGWATVEDVQKEPPKRVSQRANATIVHALSQYGLRPMETLRDMHVPHTLSLFGEDE